MTGLPAPATVARPSAPAACAPGVPRRSPYPRTPWFAGAAATILLGCGDRPASTGNAAMGAAPDGPPAEVDRSDFAGSESCSGCHADQYAEWAGSTHGRAGGEPGPETVVAPFDGTPIVFADGAVIPRVDSSGRYLFEIRLSGITEQIVHVDGVIGGGHMLGGGTQGFVAHAADGTVRFLPFDYSPPLGEWFCNTGTRAERGWVPITADMSLADCGDWPPARILGTYSRFANCQSCHGSQITTHLEPGTGAVTRWASLDINCESCHGPALRHVELMAANPAADLPDIAMASRVTDGVEESLGVCFRCHALKDVVTEGYLPGAPFADHYALKLPVLGDDPYLPDGRVKTFAYQGTHLSSSCYVDGNMTCVSCHEPHGLGYWDVNRTPLAGVTDDRQCTACHAAKAMDPEAHTFHAPESPGSRCVSCHMPYLQHPEVGDGVPFARSDHTIPIPRPALDARLALVSACRGCHGDISEIRLQASVDEWWGVTKPHDPVTAGLLAVTDAMGEDLAARMLLHPADGAFMAQFQALVRFVGGWVRPGDGLGDEAAARIGELAASDDPDVRALALAVLHAASPGPGSEDQGGTAPLLDVAAAAALEPEAVRRRWTMVLGFLSDEALARGETGPAEALLGKALAVLPGDPAILRAMGLLHNQAGNPRSAIRAFAESLAGDPNQPLVHVNLGIARAAAGEPAAAIREYEAAIALNPREPLAHFNLGNLYLRSDNVAGAIQSYERAVALAPELARAELNLAIALARAGRIQEALPHGRRAVEFAPGDETARRVLSDLEAAANGRPPQ